MSLDRSDLTNEQLYRLALYGFEQKDEKGVQLREDPTGKSLSRDSARQRVMNHISDLLAVPSNEDRIVDLLAQSAFPWDQIFFKAVQKESGSSKYDDTCALLLNLSRLISKRLAASTNADEISALLKRRDQMKVLVLKDARYNELLKRNLLPEINSSTQNSPAMEHDLQKLGVEAQVFARESKNSKVRQAVIAQLNQLIDTNNPAYMNVLIEKLNTIRPPIEWNAILNYVLNASPKIGHGPTEDDPAYSAAGLRNLLVNLGELCQYAVGKDKNTGQIRVIQDALMKYLDPQIVYQFAPEAKDFPVRHSIQNYIPDPELNRELYLRLSDDFRLEIMKHLMEAVAELQAIPLTKKPAGTGRGLYHDEIDPKCVKTIRAQIAVLHEMLAKFQMRRWNPTLHNQLAERIDRVGLLADLAEDVLSAQVNKGTFAIDPKTQRPLKRWDWRDVEYKADLRHLRRLTKDAKDVPFRNPGVAALLEAVGELTGQEFQVLTRHDIRSATEVLAENRRQAESKDHKASESAELEATRRIEETRERLASQAVADVIDEQTPTVVHEAKVEVALSAYEFAKTGDQINDLLENAGENRADYEDKISKDPSRIKKLLSVNPKNYGENVRAFLGKYIGDIKWQDAMGLSPQEVAHLFAVDERQAISVIDRREENEKKALLQMQGEGFANINNIMAYLAEKAKNPEAVEKFLNLMEEVLQLKSERHINDDRRFEMYNAANDPLLRFFLEEARFPKGEKRPQKGIDESMQARRDLEAQRRYLINLRQGLGGLLGYFQERIQSGQSAIPERIEPIVVRLNLISMALSGESSAPFMGMPEDSLSGLSRPTTTRSHQWIAAILNDPNAFVDRIHPIVSRATEKDLVDAANRLFVLEPKDQAYAKLVAMVDNIPEARLVSFMKATALNADCRRFLLGQYVNGNIHMAAQQHVAEIRKQNAERKFPEEKKSADKVNTVKELSEMALDELAAEFKELNNRKGMIDSLKKLVKRLESETLDSEFKSMDDQRNALAQAKINLQAEWFRPYPLIVMFGEVGKIQEHMENVGSDIDVGAALVDQLKQIDISQFEGGKAGTQAQAGSAYYYAKFLHALVTAPASLKFLTTEELQFFTAQLRELENTFHWRDRGRGAFERVVLGPERSSQSDVKEQEHLDFNTITVLQLFQNIIAESESPERTTHEAHFIRGLVSEAHAKENRLSLAEEAKAIQTDIDEYKAVIEKQKKIIAVQQEKVNAARSARKINLRGMQNLEYAQADLEEAQRKLEGAQAELKGMEREREREVKSTPKRLPYLTLIEDKKFGPKIGALILNSATPADVRVLPKQYKKALIKQASYFESLNTKQRNNLSHAYSSEELFQLLSDLKKRALELAEADPTQSRRCMISAVRLISDMVDSPTQAPSLNYKLLQRALRTWSTQDFQEALMLKNISTKATHLMRVAMLTQRLHVKSLTDDELLYHVNSLNVAQVDNKTIILLIDICNKVNAKAGETLFHKLFQSDAVSSFSADDFKAINVRVRASLWTLDDLQMIMPTLGALTLEQLQGLTYEFNTEQWQQLFMQLTDPSMDVPNNVYQLILGNKQAVDALLKLGDDAFDLIVNLGTLSLLTPEQIKDIHPAIKMKLFQNPEFLSNADSVLQDSQLRMLAHGLSESQCNALLNEWNPPRSEVKEAKAIPLVAVAYALPIEHQMGIRLIFGAHPRLVSKNLQDGSHPIGKQMGLILFNDLGKEDGLWSPVRTRVTTRFLDSQGMLEMLSNFLSRTSNPDLQDYMFALAMRRPDGKLDLTALDQVIDNPIFIDHINKNWDPILESANRETLKTLFNNYKLLAQLTDHHIKKAIDRAAAIGFPPTDYLEVIQRLIEVEEEAAKEEKASKNVSGIFIDKVTAYIGRVDSLLDSNEQQRAMAHLLAWNLNRLRSPAESKGVSPYQQAISLFAEYAEAKGRDAKSGPDIYHARKLNAVADVVFMTPKMLASLVNAEMSADPFLGSSVSALAKNKIHRMDAAEARKLLYTSFSDRDEEAQYKLALLVKKHQTPQQRKVFDAFANPIIKKYEWKKATGLASLVSGIATWYYQRKINTHVKQALLDKSAQSAPRLLRAVESKASGKLEKRMGILDRLRPKMLGKDYLAARKAEAKKKKETRALQKELAKRELRQAKRDRMRARQRIKDAKDYKSCPIDGAHHQNRAAVAKAGKALLPVLESLLNDVKRKREQMNHHLEVKESKSQTIGDDLRSLWDDFMGAQYASSTSLSDSFLEMIGWDKETLSREARAKLFKKESEILSEIAVCAQLFDMSRDKVSGQVEHKGSAMERVWGQLITSLRGGDLIQLLETNPDEILVAIIKLQNAINKGCEEYKALCNSEPALGKDEFYKNLIRQQHAVNEAVKALATIPQYNAAMELIRYRIELQHSIAKYEKMQAQHKLEKDPREMLHSAVARQALEAREQKRGIIETRSREKKREKRNEAKREGIKAVTGPMALAYADFRIGDKRDVIADLSLDVHRVLRSSDDQIARLAPELSSRYRDIRSKFDGGRAHIDHSAELDSSAPPPEYKHG